jgi:PAS domain S-box-containing protein
MLAYGIDISRRKRTERDLRDSEERFRTLVEATPDWVWEVDRNGVYTYASPRLYELLGYEPEEVLGKTPFDLMPGEEAQRLAAKFADIVHSEAAFEQLENVNLHRDGHEVVLETSGVPFFDEDGRLLGYRGIDRDITARKQAERAMQESELKYHALLENASDAILLAVPGGGFIEANRQAECLLGCTREEILGMSPFDIHAPEDHDNVRAAFHDLMTKGRSLYEHSVMRKDGTRVPVEVAGTLFSYGNRTVALGVFRDITERKQAEAHLRELNEQLEMRVRERTAEVHNQQLALDHHSIVGITDRTGKIIYANDKFCAITQYSQEELHGQNHRILNSGHHPKSFFNNLWRTIGAGQVWQGDICNRRKDGSLYWVNTTIVPFLDSEGKPYQYVSIRTDITELKKSQEQQRRRQRRLNRQQRAFMTLAKGNLLREEQMDPIISTVTEIAADTLRVDRASVWLSSEEGDCVECRDMYCRAAGAHQRGERLMRTDYPEFFSQLENNRILTADDARGDSRFAEMKCSYLMRTDVVALMSVPVRLDGETVGMVCYEQQGRVRHWHSDEQQFAGAIADLIALAMEQSGRRHAERKLAAFAQRLEQANAELSDALEQAQEAARVKSEFLATMSHEIRTPMNGVLGMLNLVADTALDSDQKDYVDIAQQSAQSLLGLLDNVLDYSRIEAGRLELEHIEFVPGPTAEDVARLMGTLAEEKGIRLEYELEHGLHTAVWGDPTRFRQVVVNLLSNAIKFTRAGSVSLHGKVLEDAGGRLRVRFTVQDTGIGIPAEKLGVIFDSFAQADGSTTRRYGGTGLGLAICRQLIQRMGGDIGVESVEGEGSLFWFEVTMEKVLMEGKDSAVSGRAVR